MSRGDIQDWMAAGRKKYAAQTVNGWLRVLRACLSDAVADGKIAQNPAALVKALRVEVAALIVAETTEPFTKKPGPIGEVQRVFEEVRKLPRSQQRKIVETVDALVTQYRRKAS